MFPFKSSFTPSTELKSEMPEVHFKIIKISKVEFQADSIDPYTSRLSRSRVPCTANYDMHQYSSE